MSFAFKNADILLPKKELDHYKWSVVACDQYTSEPEYWEQVRKETEGIPSTYHLILPEVYLGDPDAEERLEGIASYMDAYLEQEIFDEYKDAMIYVERTDSSGKIRAGIVGAIDLEAYDYHKGSSSLVRATESTVIERIPPRIKVRKNAKIELPHIMILIDDAGKTVVEAFADRKDLPIVYDFDLMQGGGHLKGALLGAKEQAQVIQALEQLGTRESFDQLYHMEEAPVLLFAMGDGNHSLATAKEFYEQLKAAHPGEDLSNHPARYALVEIVNLHSPALEFEAIHRIVTGVDKDKLMAEMTEELGLEKADVSELDKNSPYNDAFAEQEYQQFVIVDQGVKTAWNITKPCSKLTVGSLQKFLDAYVRENGAGIDYIHGEEVILALSMQANSLGFLLPDMGKEELFPTVIADGALPRKTFSMGHAQDKRFYMECRRITEGK